MNGTEERFKDEAASQINEELKDFYLSCDEVEDIDNT